MSRLFGPQYPQKSEKDKTLQEQKNALRVARMGMQVAQDLRNSDPQRAVQHAIATGMKLASEEFKFAVYSDLATPVELLGVLQDLGLDSLTMPPEILMATLDQKYGGWTPEQAAQAVENFHKTGLLQTQVSPLVRQKIYAVRITATSDAPYSEWNVFEKVGGVFNDRVAQFAVIEPLSAAECVKTIVDMIKIRPDTFTDEVNIYIAGCLHQSGFYTVSPIQIVWNSEQALQQMNYQETGDKSDPAIVRAIKERFFELKEKALTLSSIPDDTLIEVQARKLLALDSLVPT